MTHCLICLVGLPRYIRFSPRLVVERFHTCPSLAGPATRSGTRRRASEWRSAQASLDEAVGAQAGKG